MATDGTWYSYDNGQAFTCPDCKKEIAAGSIRWWNKNNKTVICDTCHGSKQSQSSAQSTTRPAIPQRTEIPSVKCDVCGDVVPSTKEVHHVLRGNKWWTVCFYCFNTVRRVRALKIAGLWPFEKKKDVGEVYGLTPSSTTLSTGSPLVPSEDGEKDG